MPSHSAPHVASRSAAAQLLRGLLGVLLLALLAPVAPAQTVPTSGDWFEETAEFGFRVKVPKDWRFIPPNLDDPLMIAKYVPTGRDWVPMGSGAQLFVWSWVLRLDVAAQQAAMEKRLREQLDIPEGEPLPDGVKAAAAGFGDLDTALLTWLAMSQRQGSSWSLVEKREAKSGKQTLEERIYEGTMGWESDTYPVRVYVALLPLGEQRWAATAFNGPGDKSWKKYENGFRRLGRTLQPIERDASAAAAGADKLSTIRDDKRTLLQGKITQMPGWWLHETDNYFIITDSQDKKFINELGDRLEAIRDVYERDYPYDKARVYEDPKSKKEKGKPTPEGEDDDEEPDGATGQEGGGDDGEEPGEDDEEAAEEEEEDDDNRSFSVRNSFELSRCSVVRVCSDRDMYFEYGGPGGSAGYWHSGHEELVVYDDKENAGRSDTWSVVNHEAFHQYIFYFYGNIAPHSWYNEGTGDFYAGYEYEPKRKRFTLTPFDWRRSLARDAIRNKRYAPLREFVRWSQREYYGSNEYGLAIGDNYALGWSFIWFLRNGKDKSKHWNPAWDGILDTYLAALAESGELDEAVDTAFEGVDWAELERAWTAFPL